jgi:hypothetical protein
MIRDVLLGVFAAAWLIVMVITAWRTGGIPPELWLTLGIGAGGILAVFRADDSYSSRRKAPPDEEKPT